MVEIKDLCKLIAWPQTSIASIHIFLHWEWIFIFSFFLCPWAQPPYMEHWKENERKSPKEKLTNVFEGNSRLLTNPVRDCPILSHMSRMRPQSSAVFISLVAFSAGKKKHKISGLQKHIFHHLLYLETKTKRRRMSALRSEIINLCQSCFGIQMTFVVSVQTAASLCILPYENKCNGHWKGRQYNKGTL